MNTMKTADPIKAANAMKQVNESELYAGRKKIILETQIGAGREGTVHVVKNIPATAAKLIGPGNPDPEETAVKLQTMVDNSPARTVTRHYRIAWPSALVTTPKRQGRTVGYLMDMQDPAVYRPVGSYFNPARRRRLTNNRDRGYTYLNLVAIARNLAMAVENIHRHGAVIGDLSSRNVLASDRGRAAIIDTDSFQICDPVSGATHRCMVGTPEYTPARLQGLEFRDTDRTQDDDLFALAVMIYQLLMQGSHPYSGTKPQQTTPDSWDGETDNIAARIAQGNFSHQLHDPKAPVPTPGSAKIWEDLPLKQQFKGAFQSRKARTTAGAWAEALTNAAKKLQQCRKNPLHWSFKRRCTWCQYVLLTTVEPFPEPGAQAPLPQKRSRKKIQGMEAPKLWSKRVKSGRAP